MNVERKEGFKQVCVWPGTLLGDSTPEDFENFMKEEFGTRVQYLESIVTGPNRTSDGRAVEGTGGRSDMFFAVNDDDVANFAIPRLISGIRWIEDVLDNGGGVLYPDRVNEYRSW